MEVVLAAAILMTGVIAWLSLLLLVAGAVVTFTVNEPPLFAGVAVLALALVMVLAVKRAVVGPRHRPVNG